MIDAIVDSIATGRAHPLGMYGVLVDGERAKGASILHVGCPWPVSIPVQDWEERSVFSSLGQDVRIVAVMARTIGNGALSRLVKSIIAARLNPVVVEPIGVIMPAILEHWGWRCRVIGEGFERCEEWSPSLHAKATGAS